MPVRTRQPGRAKCSPKKAAQGSSADDYILGPQLGSDGRDKAVYEARNPVGRVVAVAQFKKTKSVAKIRKEAEYQGRAASAGLAPAVLEVDTAQRRLVMELLPGGTLLALARSQGGVLSAKQQRGLVTLLKRLGTEASIVHNDCGNPSNFIADAMGELKVIDFGVAKELRSSQHPHSNLHAIRHLLYDVQQGLITHRVLRESPDILIREYELFVDSLAGRDGQTPQDTTPATAAKPVRAVSSGDEHRAEGEESRPRLTALAAQFAVAILGGGALLSVASIVGSRFFAEPESRWWSR